VSCSILVLEVKVAAIDIASEFEAIECIGDDTCYLGGIIRSPARWALLRLLYPAIDAFFAVQFITIRALLGFNDHLQAHAALEVVGKWLLNALIG